MKLYLVRHGESECNVQRRLYGRTDCSLTEKGCRQAREAGEKLRGTGIGRCISSPLIRAAETARLAFMDGSVSHHNNGVLGEVFNAVLVSLAYVKTGI